MPLIHAYFYIPNESDNWLNHLVTQWDPPYAHCDIQFQDGMASSVFRGEKVYWKTRRFSKPGYSRVTLGVNQAEYDRAYDLCRKRYSSAMEFDAVGMLSLPAATMIDTHRGTHTFCSKHCTEVLQAAGIRSVMNLTPRAMTPSALRRVLQDESVLHTDRIDLRIQDLGGAASRASSVDGSR
jgi:hypothetical protein